MAVNHGFITRVFEQDKENVKSIDKLIRKICYISNFLYVFFHLAYLIFFVVLKYAYNINTDLMIYAGIFSVSFFLLLYLLLDFKKLNIYVLACGLEILIFMTYSTFICGFGAGFHLCLLGLIVLAYFTGYYSSKKTRVIRPVHWALFIGGLYIFLYIWCGKNEPVIALPELTTQLLFIAHLVVVISFISTFLTVFVNYAGRLEKKIIRESKTDNLTHIGNRKALEDFFAGLDLENEEYALSLFDIDDFKHVNDEFGHLCGDYILKEISSIALYTKARSDFVIRFGGEEFVMISQITSSYEDTVKKIDELRERIAKHKYIFEGQKHVVTVTIGMSKYQKGMNLYDWIMLADKNLYIGKQSGKNKVVSED